MTDPSLLNEEISDEDRAYRGSRYQEIVDALWANPYKKVWGREGEPPWPVDEVRLTDLLSDKFEKAVERTLDSGADMRWGPDRKGFRRTLHPNGICLTGEWRITEDLGYSGYFAAGSRGLVIARYSTSSLEIERGQTRSLALVGKIFPTTDPSHTVLLRPANFFTQEDIGGADTPYINDAELRNAPDTTTSRRPRALPNFLRIGVLFGEIDSHPSIRQLYPIAELGKPAGQPTRAPEFMRLLVAPSQPRIPGEAIDFRDEIMAQIFDRGDPAPKRSLTFNIEVTDEGETSGPAVHEQRTFKNWRPIGVLTFNNAVVSHNGDAVIHFSHPTWREDRNDPATATRVDERKVR